MSIILAFKLAPTAFTEEQLATRLPTPAPERTARPTPKVAAPETDAAAGREPVNEAMFRAHIRAAHALSRLAS